MFIHLSVDEQLGFFHFLATVNNAAVNMGIQMSVQVPAFSSFEDRPRSRTAESYDIY